jgi:hypothetical protein
MSSSAGDLGIVLVMGLMPSLLFTYVLNLIWSIWKTIVTYKESMSDGLLEATTRSIRQLSGTRIVAGVLTSKTFFVLVTFTTGMVFLLSGSIGFESGVHGNHVRAPNTRRAVVATIPSDGNVGEHKVVQIPLWDLERFKQANPNYSFLLPLGKGTMSGHSLYPPTEYTVTAVGSELVMVETTFNENDDHILGRYTATDREIKPLSTKTHNDLLATMIGMVFGLALAIVLASVGYILKWLLKRTGKRTPATSGQ